MDDEWVLEHNTLPPAAAKEMQRKRLANWSDGKLRDHAASNHIEIEPQGPALWPAQLGPVARYEAALERQLHRATQRSNAARRCAATASWRRKPTASPPASPRRCPPPRPSQSAKLPNKANSPCRCGNTRPPRHFRRRKCCRPTPDFAEAMAERSQADAIMPWI
jgi:hypothetical protein